MISHRTVEENILKKAHQKRLLGDIAIEGGNFTTAFFKKDSVRDLFNADEGGKDDDEEEQVVVVPAKKKTIEKVESEKESSNVNEGAAAIKDEQYEKVFITIKIFGFLCTHLSFVW